MLLIGWQEWYKACKNYYYYNSQTHTFGDRPHRKIIIIIISLLRNTNSTIRQVNEKPSLCVGGYVIIQISAFSVTGAVIHMYVFDRKLLELTSFTNMLGPR